MTVTAEVPFFKPDVTRQEIAEVIETLQSGWLTTGPQVRRFEREFAAAVRARHAVALNSCTAALHLALDALDVRSGHAVLVPTMTFAATAEVVCYLGAVPVLVDCDPATGNLDLQDMEHRAALAAEGRLPGPAAGMRQVVGIMPVHVGGLMLDMDALSSVATRHGWWVVEDAAHAFPASRRMGPDGAWRRCGEDTASVSCFSFYANKTITTGEGGMAVTADERLADRIRLMSLHGLSHDAWDRYSAKGSWDYQIVAPGYKYNLTDLAAALGIQQLARAEQMRSRREAIAQEYMAGFGDLEEIELPAVDPDTVHSWHLFSVALRLEKLTISRNQLLNELAQAGIKCSVHWRPLHLHPYYRARFEYRPEDLPNATARFERIFSLPLFPTMSSEQVAHVIASLRQVVTRYRR